MFAVGQPFAPILPLAVDAGITPVSVHPPLEAGIATGLNMVYIQSTFMKVMQ